MDDAERDLPVTYNLALVIVGVGWFLAFVCFVLFAMAETDPLGLRAETHGVCLEVWTNGLSGWAGLIFGRVLP